MPLASQVEVEVDAATGTANHRQKMHAERKRNFQVMSGVDGWSYSASASSSAQIPGRFAARTEAVARLTRERLKLASVRKHPRVDSRTNRYNFKPIEFDRFRSQFSQR